MWTAKDLKCKPFSPHKESRHKPALKNVFLLLLHRHSSPDSLLCAERCQPENLCSFSQTLHPKGEGKAASTHNTPLKRISHIFTFPKQDEGGAKPTILPYVPRSTLRLLKKIQKEHELLITQKTTFYRIFWKVTSKTLHFKKSSKSRKNKYFKIA